MIEKEVKILNINKELVIEKILQLGGVKTFEGLIIGEYYKNGDNTIRVRSEARGIVVCYKKKIGKLSKSIKTREETEIVIDNKEAFVKILLEIGFIEYKKINKKRTSFTLNGASLEVDEYENMNPILEIEGTSNKHIENTANILGFSKKDFSSVSFSEMPKNS